MKKRINLQRVLEASLDLVWELWTTKDGIESWWGPPGFEVTVSKLELRAGGALEYVMTCVGADQIAFMKQHNQPLATALKARYIEVSPKTLAAWMNLADFIPGVEPYEVETRLTLTEQGRDSVRVDLQLDAMHNEFYTSMATQGWESEIGKLAEVIARRKNKGSKP
ncbi:MAG TPA: SRPBCC domain-containing protein [Steroidobacteraceae bacterium]|jgi:uncharacterized protein YndB with AHSA1/START domain|nr:SRPBCC domain-containing protein [Steroidobacteraceae bacterium]